MQRTSLRFARSPLTLRLGWLAPRGSFEVRTAQGTLLSFCQPVAPREHGLCSSAPISSPERPPRADRSRMPPTRAFVVRNVSRFSASSRRGVRSRVSGSSSIRRATCPRTGVGHLKPGTHRVPAVPSFEPTWLPPTPGVYDAPANQTGARALASFSRSALLRPNLLRSAASLTPACSGLASLAADARR